MKILLSKLTQQANTEIFQLQISIMDRIKQLIFENRSKLFKENIFLKYNMNKYNWIKIKIILIFCFNGLSKNRK